MNYEAEMLPQLLERSLSSEPLRHDQDFSPVRSSRVLSFRFHDRLFQQNRRKVDEMPRLAPERLNGICRVLNCQPGELLEYVPDDSNDKVVSIVEVA